MKPSVLVIGGSRFKREIAGCLGSFWNIREADEEGALGAATEPHDAYSWALVEHPLSEGSGLQVIERLRDLRPTVPLVLVGSGDEPDLCNKLQAEGNVYLRRPFPTPLILSLARPVIVSLRVDDIGLARQAAAFSNRAALSCRETDVLSLAVTDHSCAAIVEVLGISANTLKTHVSSVIRKARRVGSPAMSIGEVAFEIRAAARTERRRNSSRTPAGWR